MIGRTRKTIAPTTPTTPTTANGLTLLATLSLLAACSSSNNNPTPSAPVSSQDPITVNGFVSDGPVEGGTIFAFTTTQVIRALSAVDPSGDRRAALLATNPVAMVERGAADEDQFQLSIPAAFGAGTVFLIFDNTDAEDQSFHDTPPNLESVALLGVSGSTQRINVSLHTTLIAQQVRAQLDPDGDGVPIDGMQIQSLLQAAELNVLDALGANDQDVELFPPGVSPIDTDDVEVLHNASSFVGLLARMLVSVEGLDLDDVVEALAADAGDGNIDGSIPAILSPSAELEGLAVVIDEFESRGDDDELSLFAMGPCSSSAVAMARACAADVVDNQFEGRAKCVDIVEDVARDACLAEVDLVEEEEEEECGDIFDARLNLCESLGDAAHEPAFGELFAPSFVDPTQIGVTVQPNPYFPLVAGNRWVFEGDGERVVVLVKNETKLIDGVTCVVVNDVVTEDGILVEDTDDWFAQDTDGNVWYCGEIARDYELFEGDNPQTPELIEIGGSWKAGREGAEPGILLPAIPVMGDVIRQEVLYGDAEDVIEILSLTATEAAPGGSCTGNCLQTRDFTPLDGEANENKYYAPGIGLIVEIDLNTGDRVELMSFEAG